MDALEFGTGMRFFRRLSNARHDRRRDLDPDEFPAAEKSAAVTMRKG